MVERPAFDSGPVRTVFDDWAARGWADDMEQSHGPFVRRTFARLPIGRDSWYLDIGCGNGYTVRWAADIAIDGHAVGLDLSPKMIAVARRLGSGHPNVRFHVADFPYDHPLKGVRFDVIYSMEVFYYLPDLGAALDEVRRLLRPGGTFACQVDYYAENRASHMWTKDVGIPMALLSEAEWRDAFEQAGLEVSDQFRVRLPPEEASKPWKVTEGSLVTIGRRPA